MKAFLPLVALAVFLVACAGDNGAAATSTVANTEEPSATATPGDTTPSPAPSSTPTAAPQATGVAGVALVGPMCPVIREGTPCPDRPWEGTVVVRTPSGAEVARVDTDAEGRFAMDLPPGEYLVVSLTTGVLPAPASVEVTVVAGQVAQVELLLDSGIR
jgi:hypothetical protein